MTPSPQFNCKSQNSNKKSITINSFLAINATPYSKVNCTLKKAVILFHHHNFPDANRHQIKMTHTSNVIVHAFLPDYDGRHLCGIHDAAVQKRRVRCHHKNGGFLPADLPTPDCDGHPAGEVRHLSNETYEGFQRPRNCEKGPYVRLVVEGLLCRIRQHACNLITIIF